MWIQAEERNVKVLSSMMVDITNFVDVDPKEVGVTELVYYPVLERILEENDNIDDIKEAIRRDIHDLIPKHITKEDILASINYNIHLEYGLGNDDDIDHLGKQKNPRCGRAAAESVPDRSFQTGARGARENDHPGY